MLPVRGGRPKEEAASKQVLVVGAGLMGHGIAQLFAYAGYPVTLTDVSAEALAAAPERIRGNLLRMAEQGLADPERIEPALRLLRTVGDLEVAARDANFVVEAVSENLELKQELFRRLDSFCPPEAILATNTSVISITEIAAKAVRQGRIVGTHFWNPPTLVPLVEVIPGEQTSPETVESTFNLLTEVGKHPVRVKRDVPGFVGNRLQHALWREAISIVERGIADADVVDEVVKFGFGIRLPVLGPLETAELVGLDLTLAIHDYILKHLENSPAPSPLLVDKVAKGELGFKTGRGLREWSPEGAQRVRTDLEAHLFQWVKGHRVS
ncbi:MAG: 3-hydroxyacyl-CoA dehydrogenase NAD-binding domain-containing protein [Deferrisomatales bacterium]|nr:3-hydroxyacyl-CoA dehydrogenase NAD-binding domain-containing protein [Deferrisomatales bacterium]